MALSMITMYETEGITYRIRHTTAYELDKSVKAINERLGLSEVSDGSHCPVCGAINPTNKHLFNEHFQMSKASFGMFSRNAENALSQVIALLQSRGVTHIPNIFGDIPLS